MSDPGPDPHRCTEDCKVEHCRECKQVDHLEYCPVCDDWFCSACLENFHQPEDHEKEDDSPRDENESQLDADEDHFRGDR